MYNIRGTYHKIIKKERIYMAQVNNHHKKTRIVAVAALIVGVLGLGVAFAALSTTLYINGSAKVGSANWDIRWKGLNCTATGEASVNPAATISPDFHTITVDAKFVAPNDTVTCNFDAVNEGDIAAKLDSATFANNTTGLASVGANGGVTYTFKYRSASGGATSGNSVGAADLDLAVNAKHEMQLVLTNANTSVQGTESTESFSFSLPYVQKNQ
jgi:hypothetical protein